MPGSYRAMNSQYTDQLNRARDLLKAGEVDAAILQCQGSLGSNPARFDANVLLGQCLLYTRRYEEAEQAFRQAVQLEPEQSSPYQGLARLYHARGELNDAVKHYEFALAIDPAWVNGWLDLSIACHSNGQLQQALKAGRHALDLAPDNAVAHSNLGSFLLHSIDLDEAEGFFRKAVEIDPGFVDAIYNLGYLNSLRWNHEKAIMFFERVLQLQPGRIDATVGLAKMLERENKVIEAYDCLRPLVNKVTVDDHTLITFAQVCTSLGRANEAIAPLENLLTGNGLARRNITRIHFTLGKLYDNQENFDQAFLHFRKGNTLENKTFDPSLYKEQVESTIRTYSPAFMLNTPRATNRSGMPVFIIAMPRSGTSLVEQILSSHPQVYGAGETGDITACSEHLQPLIDKGEITTGLLDEFAEKHLEHLKSLSGGARRVTDKTVNSFINVGLIRLLFPEARIIHCMRNPLDTCLSCYFTQFGAGHFYSYGLDELAIYYREYHRVMEHWKRIPGLNYLEVRYEELVNDLEAGARSMIEFLGLDWDQACLDFHEAGRQIDTFSYDQVRQPVYTRSVNRWRNYEKQIGSLINSLADLESN